MEAIDKVFLILPGVNHFRENHMEGIQIWHGSLGLKINDELETSIRLDNALNLEYSLRPAKLEAPRNISFRMKYSL